MTPPHQHDHGLHQLLALDAVVSRPLIDDAVRRLAAHARPAAGGPRLLDVGTGAGSGTWALLETFASSQLWAADIAATALAGVQHEARTRGVADRVHPMHLDIGTSWPESAANLRGTFDIAWACLVLHEVPDTAMALENLRTALVPGGSLAVVELDAPPRFLPSAAGGGFETRVHEALRRQADGREDHPDWTTPLRTAGFDEVDQQLLVLTEEGVDDLEALRAYAMAYLSRIGPAVVPQLAGEDQRMLTMLTNPEHPQSLAQRDDIRIRTSRRLWLARRPGTAPGTVQ